MQWFVFFYEILNANGRVQYINPYVVNFLFIEKIFLWYLKKNLLVNTMPVLTLCLILLPNSKVMQGWTEPGILYSNAGGLPSLCIAGMWTWSGMSRCKPLRYSDSVKNLGNWGRPRESSPLGHPRPHTDQGVVIQIIRGAHLALR